MSHTTPQQDQVAALEEIHGQEWEIFTTPRVVTDGGTLWLARFRHNHMVMVRGHNAAEIDRKIRARETQGETQ